MDNEREAWLAGRKRGITATDATAIMGLSPWKTPAMVQAEKLGLGQPVEENEAMRWGKAHEPAILAEYGRRTGATVRPNGLDIITSQACPLAVCTPDAWIDHPTRGAGLLEAKATSARAWDRVPEGYLVQVQWQMLVTARPWADVAALHASTSMHVYEIEGDEGEQAMMYELCSAWWQRHVVNGDPVPAVAGDVADLQRVRPVPGRRIILPPDARDIIGTWESAKAAKRLAEDAEKSAKAKLLQLLGDAEVGEIPGLPKVLKRQVTQLPERVYQASESQRLSLVRG